ncbi:MAG: MFS transporter [Alphaproteobacteria bacterium]|nr:MFS transporter [Alphaproteobacteria bacterium]
MSSAVRPLQLAQFRYLWLGLLCANFGGILAQFGLGWLLVLIAEGEGRPELASFYIGLVGLSRGVPGLVFGLLSGVFADRFDGRKIMVVIRALSMCAELGLAALVLTDRFSLPLVLALSFVSGAADSMDLPVRQSIVARVLPADMLVAAQGLSSAAYSIVGISGPLVAALLIGPVGVGGILLCSAAAQAASWVALARLAPVPAWGAPAHGMVRSLGEGLLYVLRDPVLRWVGVLSATASLWVRPMPPMMPAFARNELGVGATELGWLLAAGGIGGVLGTLAPVVDRPRGRDGLAMLCCVAAWGALAILFGFQRQLGPALVLAPLPFACWFAFASYGQVLCQALPPDHLRGRALAMYGVTTSAFIPLGALVVGSLGTLLGVGNAIVLGGAVTLAVGCAGLATSAATRAASVAGRGRR